LDETDGLTSLEAEDAAQKILVRLFRRILRRDLLARILHPDIYKLYLNKEIRLDQPSEEGSTSLEFAFSAGRLGHAMVREKYRLNKRSGGSIPLLDVIKTSSRHNPKWLPIEHSDIIDWDLFFEPEQEKLPDAFNWALRFGPQLVGSMKTNIAAALPEGNTDGFDGTVYRDLIREASGAMVPVRDLIGYTLTKPPHSNWGTLLDDILDENQTVRRQSIWNRMCSRIREYLPHQLGYIRRRLCCVASVAFA